MTKREWAAAAGLVAVFASILVVPAILGTEFKAERMTDATDATTIDDHMEAFEDSVVALFGIPTDTALTGSVTTLDTSTRITNLVRFYGTGTAGIRIRDPNDASEVALAYSGGELKLYDNTGTESVPVWSEVAALDAATGNWDDHAQGARVIMAADDPNVPTTTIHTITWGSAEYDDASFFDPNDPTRITIPTTGRYRFTVLVELNENYTDFMIKIGLEVNGALSDLYEDWWNGDATKQSQVVKMMLCGEDEFTAGQYLEVHVYHNSTTALDKIEKDGTVFMITRLQ